MSSVVEITQTADLACWLGSCTLKSSNPARSAASRFSGMSVVLVSADYLTSRPTVSRGRRAVGDFGHVGPGGVVILTGMEKCRPAAISVRFRTTDAMAPSFWRIPPHWRVGDLPAGGLRKIRRFPHSAGYQFLDDLGVALLRQELEERSSAPMSLTRCAPQSAEFLLTASFSV